MMESSAMPPTFLLEAFGQLSLGSKLSCIDSGEEGMACSIAFSRRVRN